MMFGWMIAFVGVVPIWIAVQAVKRGSVRVGDKVETTRYVRADAPVAFWFGAAFYAVLGVGLIVLGVLVLLGVLQ